MIWTQLEEAWGGGRGASRGVHALSRTEGVVNQVWFLNDVQLTRVRVAGAENTREEQRPAPDEADGLRSVAEPVPIPAPRDPVVDQRRRGHHGADVGKVREDGRELP